VIDINPIVTKAAMSIPFTVHEIIDRAAFLFPSKLFLVADQGELTYSQVIDLGRKLAYKLKTAEVGIGDRVLVACGNSLYVPIYLYATSLLGAITVPVSTQLRGSRLDFVLQDCSPCLVVTTDKYFRDRCAKSFGMPISYFNRVDDFIAEIDSIQKYEEVCNVIDLDLIVLMYTSGSTGMPKAVALCHSNVLSATESIARYLDIIEQDRILNCIPFTFDYGFFQILLCAIRGATLYIRPNFAYKEDIFSLIDNANITGIPFVSTQFTSIYARGGIGKRSFPSVRFITNTGSPFPEKYFEELKCTFPNAKIFSMYGLTECKRVSYLDPEKLPRKLSSVGKAMPNVRVRIIDESHNEVGAGVAGQLAVEGRNVMKGYWNNPNETKRVIRFANNLENPTLLTGDYFKTDVEGDLYFLGRRDDIVKICDTRISTKDLESVIACHEMVQEVAVIAYIKDMYTPLLFAFIVPFSDKHLQANELRAYIAQNVESPNMIPARLVLYNELPKTEHGKIDYSKLRKEIKIMED